MQPLYTLRVTDLSPFFLADIRTRRQRKELPHARLMGETITQLSSQFKPDVNMIKKRLESLIEREYLERLDTGPMPSYRYLA